MEIYAGDVTHFEQDCYLDRYCMKVKTWIFFYSQEKGLWDEHQCPTIHSHWDFSSNFFQGLITQKSIDQLNAPENNNCILKSFRE
jgi:hypothetical protein